MNDLLEWIKRLSVRHDIPVFGIARSLHLENDPPGYRPSDLLPSAESISVPGIACSTRNIQVRGKNDRELLEGGQYLLPAFRRNPDAGCAPHRGKWRNGRPGLRMLPLRREGSGRLLGISITGKDGRSRRDRENRQERIAVQCSLWSKADTGRSRNNSFTARNSLAGPR